MIKRLLDFCIAFVALLVLAPILAVVAVLIRLTMGSPVVFRQRRVGLNGRIFTVLKFRTMTDERGPDGELLPDEKRLVTVGRLLRKTSLDEVPQLWNVVKGEMSLVGPRPLLPEYLPRYTPEQARRHDALPGITGWAQIHGRNSVNWEERFILDVWYVDHQSLMLDVKIIALTLREVFRRTGISAQGHATMPVFEGTKDERISH